jgi:hypothetical protein
LSIVCICDGLLYFVEKERLDLFIGCPALGAASEPFADLQPEFMFEQGQLVFLQPVLDGRFGKLPVTLDDHLVIYFKLVLHGLQCQLKTVDGSQYRFPAAALVEGTGTKRVQHVDD